MKLVKSYHILLDYELWKEAKIAAIKADKSMVEFVSNAIKEKVENQVSKKLKKALQKNTK